MSDKGNLAKRGPAPGRTVCPACCGRPPMVPRYGRLVPEYCERCDGRGTVPITSEPR